MKTSQFSCNVQMEIPGWMKQCAPTQSKFPGSLPGLLSYLLNGVPRNGIHKFTCPPPMDSTVLLNLPNLLFERSISSTTGISFLDDTGEVVQTTSYTNLYIAAQDYARRLLLSGVRPKGVNVVIASFENHYDHILLFWACCLGRILSAIDSRKAMLTVHFPIQRACPSVLFHLFTQKKVVASFSSITFGHCSTNLS